MRCEGTLGRNPWMNTNLSVHHLFLYIWKHFSLWEFHNKIHVLLRERRMSCCSHFTLHQLRHQKSEARKTGREKTKRRGGLRKVRDAEMPPPQRMGGSFPEMDPFRPHPGLQLPWSKLSNSMPSTDASWLSSHKSTWSPSSLPPHRFFLPLSSHRKNCMVQISAFVLHLCWAFQNFFLRLILTGSFSSIHPQFRACHPTRNAMESFCFPLLATSWASTFHTVHLQPGPFRLPLHSVSGA